MHILCDTSSILMVIRIAPVMFTDPRFDCATLPSVRDEIFSTPKFRHKYPWRDRYRSNIVALTSSEIAAVNHEYHIKTVRNLVKSGVTNDQTGRFFDLSRVDLNIAAFVVAAACTVSTGDAALADFLRQEFETENISALGLVNRWLEAGLVVVDTDFQAVLENWRICREHPQPRADITAFERMTGVQYPGP